MVAGLQNSVAMKVLLVITLFLSSTAFATASSRCSQALGAIKGFKPFFKPKYAIAELPPQPKLLLGESGQNILYLEKRMIQNKPQLVTVKYAKYNFLEVKEEAGALRRIRTIFQNLDLLKYFDVLTPLYVGEYYAVYPYVEALSLSELTYEMTKDSNPPEKYKNTYLNNLGPPGFHQYFEVARVWSEQQRRLKLVRTALKRAGFKIEDELYLTSWFGVNYLDYFVVKLPDGKIGFSMRDDMLVTVDGRFVISDPY